MIKTADLNLCPSTNEANDKPFVQVANRTLIQVRETDRQTKRERERNKRLCV